MRLSVLSSAADRPVSDLNEHCLLMTPVGVSVRLKPAQSFFDRLRGLTRYQQIDEGFGLLIPGCRAVHTIGMRCAIDVIFFDREMTVLRVIAGISPMRVAFCPEAVGVIELASGASKRLGLFVGHRLNRDDAEFRHLVCRLSRVKMPAIVSAAKCVLVCIAACLAAACSTGGPTVPVPKLLSSLTANEIDAEYGVNAGRSTEVPPDRSSGPLLKSTTSVDTKSVTGADPSVDSAKPSSDDLKKLQADSELAYQSGRLSEALAGFTRLTQVHPEARAAWLRIGNIHQKRGTTGLAMRAYRLAARSGDTDPNSVEIRAKALFNIAFIGLEQAHDALESLAAMPTDFRLARDAASLERQLLEHSRALTREQGRLQRPISNQSLLSETPADQTSASSRHQALQAGLRQLSPGDGDTTRAFQMSRPVSIEVIRGQMSP